MNPIQARKRIVHIYQQTQNYCETARRCHTSPQLVRKWVKRYRQYGEQGLHDLPKTPKRQPRKTDPDIEQRVLQRHQKTRYGRQRLARHGIHLSPNTIRHILKRHAPATSRPRKPRRRFYPAHWAWETQEPFTLIQADVKDIYDKGTLGTDEGAVVWESVLQSLGFTEPARAYRALCASLADAPPDERRAFEAILPALLTACARTPDPDRALTGLQRLADAFPSRAGLYLAFAESPEVLHRLAELAQSPALLNRLLAHLELLEMLFGEEIVARGAKSLQEHRDALAQRLERCRSASARLASLSAYMRREWLRIGARDLWSETTPLQTARDLSALARAVLPALWEQVAPDQTLWLVGFGSLGAGELGCQSDWDLAFACPDDADLPTLERHAQAFLAHCQRLTEQGVFPPVDTQLRPEGKAGALVRTVSGWRAYYAQAAAPWERLAAVRADVLNADADAPIVAVLNEYRFGDAPTPDERDEMRRLILRALTERVPSSALHTHLKLGYAGQNAIEFLTHWLVAQHATLDDHPPSTGTLTQLEWLWRRGILETADYDALRDAWRMLYQVRNRLALLFDPAPEVLPDDSRLGLLARSLNYDSPDALRRVLTEHQRAVEAITRRWWEHS